jgi:hypothetical protein
MTAVRVCWRLSQRVVHRRQARSCLAAEQQLACAAAASALFPAIGPGLLRSQQVSLHGDRNSALSCAQWQALPVEPGASRRAAIKVELPVHTPTAVDAISTKQHYAFASNDQTCRVCGDAATFQYFGAELWWLHLCTFGSKHEPRLMRFDPSDLKQSWLALQCACCI